MFYLGLIIGGFIGIILMCILICGREEEDD